MNSYMVEKCKIVNLKDMAYIAVVTEEGNLFYLLSSKIIYTCSKVLKTTQN